jgi:4-amino-4-deoxy-L-arabinose transferase-like glycosyltransferase
MADSSLSRSAWGAIGATGAFISLTWWWLTQDTSIPIYDAGVHLERVIHYHQLIQAGDLLGPFNHTSQYPPLAHLVGALGMFVGRVDVASPIIAENLVFVSLLALGCYRAGCLLFGERAGLLAAVFVLGSPLLIAQFHVFMLDAPETALVAVSIWLLLASEGFARTRIVCFAGLTVGCGLLVKVQFPFFVAGIVFAMLMRGGWRNYRNLAMFATVTFAVGLPWYVDHLSELGTIARLAGTGSGAAPGNLPPTLSIANLMWYFWSTLNSQLFAPLFVLVLGGVIWTALVAIRLRKLQGPLLELLTGCLVAWLAISLTPHHDLRYDMPLMPYLALIGTGWIVHLPRLPRLATTGLLVLAVVGNTLAITFGVGGHVEIALVSSPPAAQSLPDRIVLYSNSGFLVSGPKRDGDIPGLLKALRDEGIEIVAFSVKQSEAADFSFEGLGPLAMIAGLLPSIEPNLVNIAPTIATLVHEPIVRGAAPACATLSDGTGVWVLRRVPKSGGVWLYCPFRHPQYYG